MSAFGGKADITKRQLTVYFCSWMWLSLAAVVVAGGILAITGLRVFT